MKIIIIIYSYYYYIKTWQDDITEDCRKHRERSEICTTAQLAPLAWLSEGNISRKQKETNNNNNLTDNKLKITTQKLHNARYKASGCRK